LAAFEAELSAHSTKSIHHLAIGGWRINEAEALESPVQVLINAVRHDDVQPLRLPDARGISVNVSATSDFRETESEQAAAAAPTRCIMR
jgi:hypothetical protein